MQPAISWIADDEAKVDELLDSLILGALSNPSVKATYGVERERTVGARLTVDRHVNPSTVETWMKHGSEYDLIWALDYAITHLEAMDLDQRRPQQPQPPASGPRRSSAGRRAIEPLITATW